MTKQHDRDIRDIQESAAASDAAVTRVHTPAHVAKEAAAAPTIGRIVHYTDGDKTCAAVVSGVNGDGTVALHVFRRTGHAGQADIDNVAQANVAVGATGFSGHWHWPPRS